MVKSRIAVRNRLQVVSTGTGRTGEDHPSRETMVKQEKPICYGISAYDSNSMKSKNPHSGIYVATTSRCLDLNGGNPACNQGGIMILTRKEDDTESVGRTKQAHS